MRSLQLAEQFPLRVLHFPSARTRAGDDVVKSPNAFREYCRPSPLPQREGAPAESGLGGPVGQAGEHRVIGHSLLNTGI